MPPAITKEQVVREIQDLALDLGRRPTQTEWSSTYSSGAHKLQKWGGWTAVCNEAVDPDRQEFLVDKPPEGIAPLEEILDRRAREHKRTVEKYAGKEDIKVTVPIDGPIAIAHMGDPHLDAPGTNIELLQTHIDIIRETDGMWAANVGDVRNNWIGRLARKYDEQVTTAEESWVLAEWFFNSCPFLYLVGGNHDAWCGPNDPVKWIMRHKNTAWGPSSVRLALQFPNGRVVTISARHDFPGSSQWNTAHQVSKAAQIGYHDNILVGGHRHASGYNIVKDPNSKRLSHCLQICAYEEYSTYANRKGFRDQRISPCVVTTINPDATRETQLVKVDHDLEDAARYLTYLRR